MKKPKILFILHLPPPMHGASMVGEYIRQSQLINSEFDADYIDLATNKILKQSGKPTIKKLFTFSRLLTNLYKTLSGKKYDLCYITLTACGAGFYKDMVVVSFVKLFHKNIVYHFHNKGISHVRSSVNDKLYRYVFKNTKSILLSPYLYSDIKKYVKETDVFYCPCGIPETDEKLLKIDTITTDVNGAPCKILFLSNMMREKGIFVLLDACEQLMKNKICFECHFVGGWLDVSEDDFNKIIKEKKLDEFVFVHGPKYNDDKYYFFNNANVFVFPTFYHYETFGLVNLEAMQHKLPIVSTPEGGIPDVVIHGETGFLVPQHDAAALAEKLTLLIQDAGLRNQMGEAGKKRYKSLFTIEKFENNMVNILRTVANKN